MLPFFVSYVKFLSNEVVLQGLLPDVSFACVVFSKEVLMSSKGIRERVLSVIRDSAGSRGRVENGW